jgi:hypothetical protein
VATPRPSAETVQETRRGVTARDEVARATQQARMGTATAAAAGAPGPLDLSTVTPDQLAALRTSRDPLDRRMAATAARAQTAYADHMAAGGRVTVSRSAGNGGHPVVTLLPPGFDPTKPARVHTHYHGWNATVADPKGHGSGTTSRMQDIQQRDPQAVFVLPECANAPARGGAVQTDWSNVRSQSQTTQDALAAAGVTNVGTRIVSAHSGGGSAIANAIRSSRDGSGLQADRLELQDSLYGSETAVADWASTPAGQAARSVVYLRGTNDAGRDRRIAAAFGDRFQQVAVRTPRADEIPFVVGRDGRPTAQRAFNADAHNRTVGQYMDSIPGP